MYTCLCTPVGPTDVILYYVILYRGRLRARGGDAGHALAGVLGPPRSESERT